MRTALPANAREATVELLLGVVGAHVVASLILLANMVQAQVLAGQSTLAEVAALASSYPLAFAGIVFGPHLETNMTPVWAATVAVAYAVGLFVSVGAIRLARGFVEDRRVERDVDDVDLEEFATDGGVDVDVDGIPQWRRLLGALTVFVVGAVVSLALVGVAIGALVVVGIDPTAPVEAHPWVSGLLTFALVVGAFVVGETVAARVADRVALTPREREALRGEP